MYNSEPTTPFPARRHSPWTLLVNLAEILRGGTEREPASIPAARKESPEQMASSVPPLADHLRNLLYGEGVLIRLSRVALAAHAIGRGDAVSELNLACNHMRRALELLGEEADKY